METEEHDEKPDNPDVNVAAVREIREICKLHNSDRMKYVLTEIEKYALKPRSSSEMIGNVEADPEYRLIVEANNLAVEVDTDICKFISCNRTIALQLHTCTSIILSAIIHKFTKEKYQKRFPELDSLIMGELEYISTVKELGNDLDRAKNNEILQKFLTQATIMIVSVTASTTIG
jgi:U4/U6 small nuclear ribonucleoprotein PRP31